MIQFPSLRYSNAIADYRDHGDPLRLFTEIYAVMRPKRADDSASAIANHLALLDLLDADEGLRQGLRDAFAKLISTRAMVSYLTDSGILPPTGFFSELMRIVSHRLLPEIQNTGEFRDCLHIVLNHKDDWVWLGEIPIENSIRFWHQLIPAGELGEHERRRLVDQFIEAMLVLAYRISGLDVQQDLLRLGGTLADQAPAFRAVAGEAQRYANALHAAHDNGERPQDDEKHLLVLIDQCQDLINRAHRAAQRVGTSLSLSFTLRRAYQCLSRLEVLATLLGSHWRDGGETIAIEQWSNLVRQTVRAENQRNSIRQHVSRGIGLLALRVTDNAAKSGEHYITESRSAYYGMWRSAMGAGAIIAVLALLKIFTSKLDLAPIGYAFLYSMIYGLGFALIYMLHLTIATKQPAMTAQTIASYLGEAENGKQQELDRLVDLIAAVARSQIAAIIGNVAIALPVAMLIGLAWANISGEPMLDPGKGAHLIGDLDPLGWALPHAAIAGVFLFFSGIISGYFDNLASYSRIGERVAQLRWLGLLAGRERAAGIGNYVDANLGGLSGNFLFGCMLGTAGTIGMILGLPIDIRHIAFSSANLGYALTAFRFDLPLVTLAWGGLGVLLIGFINLGVSFALALWMSLRAREVAFTQTRELLSTLWQRLKSDPRSFVSAPAESTTAPPGAPPAEGTGH